jgi:hypothetical protein
LLLVSDGLRLTLSALATSTWFWRHSPRRRRALWSSAALSLGGAFLSWWFMPDGQQVSRVVGLEGWGYFAAPENVYWLCAGLVVMDR